MVPNFSQKTYLMKIYRSVINFICIVFTHNGVSTVTHDTTQWIAMPSPGTTSILLGSPPLHTTQPNVFSWNYVNIVESPEVLSYKALGF